MFRSHYPDGSVLSGDSESSKRTRLRRISRGRSTPIHALFVLLLTFIGLAAGYSDPQGEFSLDSPGGWQIRTGEKGVRKAVLEALDGAPSLTVLARKVSETARPATQPYRYERIVGSVGAQVIVVEMNTESVKVAGHPAIRKTYTVLGPRLRRARILATFVTVGPLSLTIAATVSEQGFSRSESLFDRCLTTLRFSRSLTEAVGMPPSGAGSSEQAKRKELEDALRQGTISKQEYVKRKAYLAFHEDFPGGPLQAKGYRLRYGVRPGSEFRARVVMSGRAVTEPATLEQTAVGSENAWKYELEAVQSVLAGDEPGTFLLKIVTRPETVVMLADGTQQDVGRVGFPETTIRMTPQGGALGLSDFPQKGGAAADRALAGFMSLRNSFPRFPERNVKIGERWDLQASPSGGGAEGFVQFIGLEEVKGQQCAVLRIHSSMPMTLPSALQDGLTREGFHVEGRIETDMHQFFALHLGWPIMGDGGTLYETRILKDGDPVSHTSFQIDVNYELSRDW